MSYEEFVDFICNGIYESNILLEIVKTNIYQNYLEQEKKEQKRNDLQCVDIDLRLDSSNNIIEDLNTVSMEIMSLEMENISQKNSKNTKNLEYVVERYLETVIENIEDIDLEDKCIKVCFILMNLQMRNYQVLTHNMIKFYLHTRIKELNLQDVCKNVLVSSGKSDCFGKYVYKDVFLNAGILRIFSEYFPNWMKKYCPECDMKAINLNVNLMSIRGFSYEIAHILISKEYFSIESLDWLQSCFTNKKNNYLYRGSQLRNRMGNEKYNEHHDNFIEEVMADMFSFFDANQQLLTNFKSCYNKKGIEIIISDYAKNIISFYTNEEGNMLSPTEKFDIFYKENWVKRRTHCYGWKP